MDRALTEFLNEKRVAVAFQPKDVAKFKSNTFVGSKVAFYAIVQLLPVSVFEVHTEKSGFIVNREDQQNFVLKAAEL